MYHINITSGFFQAVYYTICNEFNPNSCSSRWSCTLWPIPKGVRNEWTRYKLIWMQWHRAYLFKRNTIITSFTLLYLELIKHPLSANIRWFLLPAFHRWENASGVGRAVSCSVLFTGQIRFALHLRLPACSVVPLTSKSQREATRGEVRSSVELVREWILPHCGSATGKHPETAGRQLLSSSPPTASGSCCAASALPGCENGNFRLFSRVLISYISLLSEMKWKINSPSLNSHSLPLFELV